MAGFVACRKRCLQVSRSLLVGSVSPGKAQLSFALSMCLCAGYFGGTKGVGSFFFLRTFFFSFASRTLFFLFHIFPLMFPF